MRGRESSPTPSTTRTDAERIVDWFRNRKRRSSAGKSPPAEDHRVYRGTEETTGADQEYEPVQDQATPAEPVEQRQEPETATTEPNARTALRSHPVTNGDTAEPGTTGETAGTEAVNGNADDAANVQESAAKTQNRRSKRWSLDRLLGRNGKNEAGEEATTAEHGGDTGPSDTAGTNAGEGIIRDSRFVENL